MAMDVASILDSGVGREKALRMTNGGKRWRLNEIGCVVQTYCPNAQHLPV